MLEELATFLSWGNLWGIRLRGGDGHAIQVGVRFSLYRRAGGLVRLLSKNAGEDHQGFTRWGWEWGGELGYGISENFECNCTNIGREVTDTYDMGAYEFQLDELPQPAGVREWMLYGMSE